MSFLGDNLGQPFNPNAGYTPAAVNAMNNNNNAYWGNQSAVSNYGQSVIDQNNAAWARTNPATDYGHVGGYPSFGDPAPPGTYGGGYPSGSVEKGPDLPDISGPPTYGAPTSQMSWIQQQAMDPGSSWYDPVFAREHGGGVDFPQAPASAPPAVPAGAQDWGQYFNNITAPAAAKDPYNPMSQYNSGGYDPYSAGSYAPAAQQNLGAPASSQMSWIQQQAMDPGSSWYDPVFAASHGGGGGGREGIGSPGFNTYGYPASGQVGQADPFAGYPAQSSSYAKTPAPPAEYFSQQPVAPVQYGDVSGLNWFQQQALDPGSSWYDASFAQRFGMGFDPNSFANRFAAGGYYQPGTPSQISGYAPNGYDPLSGQAPPYTYKPGFVQGPGGQGDWAPQQIPGMNTLSQNDMSYRNPAGSFEDWIRAQAVDPGSSWYDPAFRPAGSDSMQNMTNTGG
jgi:hypothetical protein